MLGSFAKIIMIRKRRDTIDGFEPRTVEHLHQTALTRIERNVSEALVLTLWLFTEHHPRLVIRKTHAFKQETFSGQRVEIAYGHQRVFQMVEEAEAQDEIKLAELANSGVFNVAEFKGNLRKTGAGLRDVFAPSVEGVNSEGRVLKNFREETDTATGVQGGRERECLLQVADHAANGFTARLDEVEVIA